MALSTSATLRVSVRAPQTSTGDLANAAATTELNWTDTLANGTNADQCDVVYQDTFTIAASGTLNIDAAGSLAGPITGTAVFVEITTVLVTADAGNTNNIVIGNGTAPIIGGFLGVAGANTIDVMPGGAFFWHSPKNPALAVTATTADILKLVNSAGTTGVTGSIIILGRSA